MNATMARSERTTADGGPREWEADLAEGPFTRRQLLGFIGMVVAVLFGVNLLAGRILPVVPDSSVADRNEFRFRGYPEYLAGAGQPASRDLVLLSNSQAYSGEYPARLGYPAQLEGLLNQGDRAGEGTPWRVHNWSVDGTTSMEYMLMAAYLAPRPPELLVASIGYADFRGQNSEEGFSHCRSDLPRLLSRPRVARELPRAFWRRHGAVEDTLAAMALDRLPATRAPEFAWCWLDQQYPGAMPLFYAPALYHHPWKLDVPRRGRRPNILRPANQAEGAAYYAYDDRSTDLLEEFLVALQGVGAERLLVVACPGNERPGSAHAASIAAFREDMRALTARHDIPFRDLSDALPREDYLDSLHFTRPNHRRYAERLRTELDIHSGP